MAEMPAGYDAWKTRSPDDDAVEEYERIDREIEDESFLAALDRDEVAPGFHRNGPYVVEVFANGVVDIVSYVVLPSRIGWEPTF